MRTAAILPISFLVIGLCSASAAHAQDACGCMERLQTVFHDLVAQVGDSQQGGTVYYKMNVTTTPFDPAQAPTTELVEQATANGRVLVHTRMNTQLEDEHNRVLIMNGEKKVVVLDQLPTNTAISMSRWDRFSETVFKLGQPTRCQSLNGKDKGRFEITVRFPEQASPFPEVDSLTYVVGTNPAEMVRMTCFNNRRAPFARYAIDIRAFRPGFADPRLDTPVVEFALRNGGLRPDFKGFKLVDLRKNLLP